MRKGKVVAPWEHFLAAHKAERELYRLRSAFARNGAGHVEAYRRFWEDSLDRLGAYLQQLTRK